MRTLKEIMTTDVYTTGREKPVVEVAASMLKGQFGSAVVMEGATMMGIFTERDVLRAAASGADLTSSPVADWMTNDVVTADADMGVDEATEAMMSQGFRHLPIVEGKSVIGIVSLRDLLRVSIRSR